jgi:hypothetical protein
MLDFRIDTARPRFEGIAERMRTGTKRALALTGAQHLRFMAKQFGPYRGGAYEDKLQSRTGATRRGLGYAVRDDELAVFAQGVHVKVQEFGGTIRPKRRKYLTIPTKSALTPSGALKGGLRLVGKRTADGQPTFILRARSGFMYVAVRTKTGKVKALYRLASQVTIKPRLNFRRTFYRDTVPFLQQQLETAAAAAVEAVR